MKRSFSFVYIVLILAGLILIAAGSYYLKIQTKTIKQEKLIGGDRDIHGCIGSAGYTWCDEKQKCLRIWEETCQEASNSADTNIFPTITISPLIIEEAIIANTVYEALIKKSGPELKITVLKIESDYATGESFYSGEAKKWFLVRKDGKWKLIWDGKGIISCSILKEYQNFPTSLIPQCFDNLLNKNISR